MKKTLFAFALLLIGVTPVAAQFDGPVENITVINASQDNGDAISLGARPGDILRFEYTITSDFDVNGFVPVMNLGDFSGATITDAGEAVFEAGSLVFPIVENGFAPFERNYVFFARIAEQCGGQTSLNVSTQGGQTTTINLNECSQTGGEGSCYGPNGCGGEPALPSTGPQTTVVSLILGILGIFFVGFLLGRRV